MKFKEFMDQNDAIDSILALNENASFDTHYALDVLKKLENISAYLLKTKLVHQDDILRFKKFVALVAKEMPKMTKAVDDIESKLPKQVPAADVKTSPRFDKMWATA